MSIEFYTDGQCCRPTVKISDTGSMSTYQKLCYVLDKIEEVIEYSNGLQDEIDLKEYSSNITNIRKLSENGDFTGLINGISVTEILSDIAKKLYIDGDFLGTWEGDTHEKIIGDIANSLLLSQTMIDAINARESIGLIYDGKQFPYDDVDIITIIDGGVF